MAAPSDQYEHTIAFAEIALQQIRALRQPALPRNFEIWYQYATGYSPQLNRAINEMLAEKNSLSDADIDRIYTTYLSPNRVNERVGLVGSRMMSEIRQVLDMIDTAAGSATSYSASLADASEELQGASDGASLRGVIERLVVGAKEMETNNKKLEARLSASRQEIEQLQQNLEAVRNESLTDPLTTLANRKFFDAELGKAIAQGKHGGEPLSLLMCDVDYFKSFNDKFGHVTGDQVLRLVAISIKQNIKGQDIAARYGGEEFAIALPKTALHAANSVADHIRNTVMTKELMKRSTGEKLGRITISIGVALLRSDDTAQSLMERADGCLYAAKRSGRNRVVGETDLEAGMALTVTAKVA
ncbi:MAG: GGDEF domain-containing protein [Hyphomicrobiales bacterium]|nr:GGDEF domain-containing protein [Hyphomicrobiales bacterium]